jgi:hypothetical protein
MTEQEHPKKGVLNGAAKKIGATTGKTASLAGAAAHADRPGKLPKKHKSRLPRREKKARQKALAAE